MATAVWTSPLLRDRTALRSYILIRAIDELGAQMLNVAIAWYVYAATHTAMSLALIGLARFLPNIGVALLAGQAADRCDRRRIAGWSLTVQALALAAFAAFPSAPRSVWPVYPLLMLVGAAQAFLSPALSAMLPALVGAEYFPRAVAVVSSVFQICTLAGPAIGGLLYAAGGLRMFGIAAGLYLMAAWQTRRLRGHAETRPSGTTPVADALGGIRYVRANRVLLGAISLDLFAVLLGGATALLPIYAHDILKVGPAGLGCLRCAPGIGAVLMGLLLAHRTTRAGAGRIMLACVAGFGLATVVFALSTCIWLSLAALAAAGAFDMVSVVIRQTLVQISTPEAMRGRVSAIQWIFIGASSELGEFESGATAALFGTVPAALLGGLGTLAVVALWAKMFPALARADNRG